MYYSYPYSYVDPEVYLVAVIVGIIAVVIVDIIFGCITRRINENKGYSGGFAWGFWLGPIGIIVVACRQPARAYSTNSYNYNNSPQNRKIQEKPAALQKAIGWKCAQCDKENDSSSNFCSQCGERRHYNWLCASCGKENTPDIFFCPKCGNKQTVEQEMIPQQKTPEQILADEGLLEHVRTLGSATEISDHFSEKFGEIDNADMRKLMSMLKEAKDLERFYGNMKNRALKLVEKFFKHDMKFYVIDRSGESVVCPVCGTEQKSNHEYCCSCGVLFTE